jgi:hypothetical protein
MGGDDLERTIALSSRTRKDKIHCMATPTRPGTEPSEDLKRELDEHVRDDEAHPNERVPAEKLIAELRSKFKPHAPK